MSNETCLKDRNKADDAALLAFAATRGSEWSDWITILTTNSGGQTVPDGFEPFLGSYLKIQRTDLITRLKRKYAGSEPDDGVYELRLTGPGESNPNVVYVGKTNSKIKRSLVGRIMQYTKSTNKWRKICEFLGVQFQTTGMPRYCHSVQVRVLPCSSGNLLDKKHPANVEGDLLGMYKYKWNIKGNECIE